LAEVTLSLRQLAALQVGDIIPIEVADEVEVDAEGLPLFRGQLGTHNKNYAIKVSNWVRRVQPPGLQELLGERALAVADKSRNKQVTTQ
jgi:flagellar motor switch protein FliM